MNVALEASYAHGRRSRYGRLMDDVIEAGLRTKVLLLSATPVNNDLSDLKAQLDLFSADRGDVDRTVDR